MRSLVILALLCGVAAAQAPADPAEAAYQEGKRLYDLREWDQAIAKFKEAYKLRADPASLFNIAQSYRLKGDCLEAQNFYKTFRTKFPNEKTAAKAEKFVAELEDCAKAAKQAGPVKTDPVKTDPVKTDPVKTDPVKTDPVKTDPVKTDPVKTEPVRPDPVEPSPGASRGGGLRLAGIVVAGVGVAALGTGVFFAMQARSKADDLENSPAWDQELYDSGKVADRNAKILLGVGGAALVGGAVIYMLGRKAGNESSQVSVMPARGGASLVWSCEL
jgi:tetratricopeptide (TPR) repeat protein